MSSSPGPPVRTLINPIALERLLHGWWRIFAVAIAIALYSVHWGPATVRAFRYLLHPVTHPAPTVGPLIQSLIESVVLVGFAWVAMIAIASYTSTPKKRFGLGPWTWRGLPAAVAVGLTSIFAVRMGMASGEAISHVDPWAVDAAVVHHPTATTPLAGALHVLDSALSGAAEEFGVLALLVVAARAANIPWSLVYPGAIALRVVFHVYYGPGFALGMGVWAAAAVALYHFTGRLWPLFIAHFAHNALTTAIAELAAQDQANSDLWRLLVGWPLDYFFILIGAAGLLVFAFLALRELGERPNPRRTSENDEHQQPGHPVPRERP